MVEKHYFRLPMEHFPHIIMDFAEKEKAAERALEDVKANFYCELCDKQYHKHHEFDNHINSYDHAHKQRLKELKQREFARNVASKSWKDEKKQEKALRRLHQLAELRKQSECVAGCRPMFKSPQVVVEQPQQQAQDTFLLAQEEKAKIADERKSSTSHQSEKLQEPLLNKDQSCIERHHLFKNHMSPEFPCSTNACNRTGVSFSFSKKVHLKLESSASVFSENVEEAHDHTESPKQKVKQAAEECYTCIHRNSKRKTNVQKPLSTLQSHQDSIEVYNLAGRNKPHKENNQNSSRESVETHLPFCKEKQHSLDLECTSSPDIKSRQLVKTRKSIQGFITSQCQPTSACIQQKAYRHSNILLTECDSEFPGRESSEGGHSCAIHFNPCIFKHSSDSSKTMAMDNETSKKDDLVHEIKPKTFPFLHVLSKDGSTAFHWPIELLLFTKTEPSISYGCNPLYFDFRLPLYHKDNGQHEVNPETSQEYSRTMDIDKNHALDLSKKKQLSSKKDNFLKPKKNSALYLKKCQLKLYKEKENKINCNAPKYISDDLNENIPNVPAYLDCSQRHCTIATSHHTEMCMRSLAQHFHNCETTAQDEVGENVCIYPLASRTKKQKCGKCDLMYSQEQANLDLVTCTSNINENGKDTLLGCKLDCPGECLEKESNVSFANDFWKFCPLQKPSSDRQSNYSDISIDSETSNTSCYCNHRSSNHSRSNLSFCCKRKQKSTGRQKCKHKKHNCLSSSDEADVDCFIHKKSQRSADCTQNHPIKYQRYLRYGHLLQRERAKQSRNRYPVCKHSRSRRYTSSQGPCIHDSGSSERSTSTQSRGSSSGSFMKESVHIWNEHKKTMRSNEEKESCSTHSENQNVNCASKHKHGICSDDWLEKEAARQKSLTAKLLLQKVKSKRNQEQIESTGSFSKACRIDVPSNLPDTSSMESETILPSQENTHSVDMNCVWNHETGEMENHTNKHLTLDNIMGNISYSNCLLQDLIQRGTTCQTLNMEASTTIKEKTDLLTDETQPLLQSCDPVTGDFPGPFVSHRYSLAPNFIDTKEEYNASMDMHQAEENLNYYPDNAMHKSNETEYKTDLYGKCISPPLSQHPIIFSPDEIDKYRFLQLQAQQHMQKQFVAKHLKVLSTTGPATLSASPAVQSVPVQQHTSVATLHQTFLQRLALSTGAHPHSSNLSLTHIHPFSQAHLAPMSISPFASTFLPTHTALLSGHPFHLVSATPIHPVTQLAIPSLPPTAFIPTWFTPPLSATASSTMHFNPLIHPFFQGQKLPPYS
ncbi:zinc finger protein 804B [Protobothrops mucrosquamatus]|uniref:zinc finger protein 804B n=1 Tax=Protobothrops mucrosquamatus TaxID=103944 RepID=UPI0010FB18DD|nr:zinc finger protein 804B [Protobothrops mucrosquamatus]